MTNEVCSMCKRQVSDVNIITLPSGALRCKSCHLKSIKSFRDFIDFWIKYKIETPEGKEYNMKILKEVEAEIAKIEGDKPKVPWGYRKR